MKLFVAWVLVPPLLLCAAELGLRLAGYGVSVELLVPRELDGKTVCLPNRAFYQRFYNVPVSHVPHEFSLPVPKPPDTFRVFVFGSSAAQGYPSPDLAFWRVLQTMLRARGQGMKTEVYSLALGGSDSHVMRAAAKACAAYQPDLFLVYMGNNELNPRVVQTLIWDRLPPWLALHCLHLTAELNHLRLVQLLRAAAGPAAQHRTGGEAGAGRDPERAYQYYQANVEDICEFAQAAGAQVLLCTVGTRLRECVPVDKTDAGPDTGARAQWLEACDAGDRLREQGRFSDALAAYARAEAAEPGSARAAYGTAWCHHELGEYAEARRLFVRARDLDAHHGRAGSRINDILRAVASARAHDGVHLLDSVQSFADASPNGVEGPELFVDHVHLSFEGNHVLARAVLETLARIEPRLAVQPPPLSLEACRERLAMSLPDVREELVCTAESDEWTGIQPTDALRQEIARLNEQIGQNADELRLEACLKAAQIDPQNELVRINQVRLTKDAAAALEAAKSLSADFPCSVEALRLLARAFAVTGEREQAIGTMRRALALCPDDPQAHMSLGRWLLEEDRLEEALCAFRASHRLTPSAPALCGIGEVLRKKGDSSGAMKAFRQSMEMSPGDPEVFEEVIVALCHADRLAEANDEMARWQKTKRAPDEPSENARRMENMAGWPAEKGTAGTRVAVLRKLFRLLPHSAFTACKFQGLFLDEAARLETAADRDGAVEALCTAIPLNPQNPKPLQDLERLLSTYTPAARRAVWEAVLGSNPGNLQVAAFCGMARVATGDIAGAKSAFGAVRSLPPEEQRRYSLPIAESLAAAGAWEDAASAYERALALSPGLDYLRGRLEEARKKATTAP